MFPLAFDGFAVNLKTTCESLNRGEEPLLQADYEKARRRLGLCRGTLVALFADRAVFVEELGQDEFWSVLGKTGDFDSLDNALGETVLNFANVFLEPTHHHVVEHLLAPHLDAAGEAVGIEQFQQGGKAV